MENMGNFLYNGTGITNEEFHYGARVKSERNSDSSM